MMNKLMQSFFILSILGLLFMGLMLITDHVGFAQGLSEYIFYTIFLGVTLYILRLFK